MTNETTSRSKQHLRWLQGELPELIASRVLDADTAERLRGYYRLGTIAEPRNMALLVFGALGALLVGGGVMLIIAHNWEELTRAARAAIALGLLAAAQLLCGYVIARRPHSAPWRESSAISLTLGVGTCIALISQTYNLGSELGDFMMAWTALSIPVVYLMDSRLSATLCLLLLLPLPSATMSTMDGGLAYLGLLALLLPYVAIATRKYPEDGSTRLLHLLTALSIPLGVGMVMGSSDNGHAEDVLMPMLATMYASMHLLGTRIVESTAQRIPSFVAPITSVGLLGLIGLALIMTFDDVLPWESPSQLSDALSQPEVIISLACAALLSALPLRAAIGEIRARRVDLTVLHILPAWALLIAMLRAATGSQWPVAVLGNLYALALSVALLTAGLGARSLGQTNVGLGALSLLIVVRFVDSELSLVMRGLAMMAVGIGFVSVNLWLVRQAKNSNAKSVAS